MNRTPLKIEKTGKRISKPIALAQTGMICFNYTKKKIIAVPEEVREKLEA
ncbi:MAG TPA: hypothetical protein VFV31_05890 [Chitinophagaceae bacterium]|nr:hypothetical protein [Chitinophagaceae bacterium]